MDAESLESLIFAVAGRLKQEVQQAATPPPPPPEGGATASDKRNNHHPARGSSSPPTGGMTEAESSLPPALDVAVSPVAGAASGS